MVLTLKEFFNFLSAPQKLNKLTSIKLKLLKSLHTLFLLLIVNLFCVIGFIFLKDSGLLSDFYNTVTLLSEGDQTSSSQLIFVIFYIIIFGPFIEELAFRLPLKFTSKNFSISIGIVLSYLSIIIIHIFSNITFLATTVTFVVGIIVYYFLLFSIAKKHVKSIKSFWIKNLKFVSYFSAFLFALYHIPMYEFSDNSIFNYIVFLPYFFMGLFFNFNRLKSGLFVTIVMHGIYNSFLLLL